MFGIYGLGTVIVFLLGFWIGWQVRGPASRMGEEVSELRDPKE